MRIVFVTTHLTTIGGAGKFLLNYANLLCQKGHRIIIIAQKIDQNNYKFDTNVIIINLGGKLPSSPFYWLNFQKIKNKYIKELNKLDVDLIISQLFPTNYYCAKYCEGKNIKHIYFCFEPYRIFYDKNYYFNVGTAKMILYFFLRLFFSSYDIKAGHDADEIIYISKFIQRKGVLLYNKSGYVHYIGIKVNNNNKKQLKFNLKSELNLNEKTQILFALGFSHHMKGIEKLIRIFSEILLSIPNICLLIGGWISKDNLKLLIKTSKKLKIPSEKIFFYGDIPDNKLDNIYAECTLTLYTAQEESYGLIPLESMKNGTPVIAFEGGPSEIIINGKTGYIMKRKDITGFSSKTIQLLKDEKLLKEFSFFATKHVSANYSLEQSVEKFEIQIEKILNL